MFGIYSNQRLSNQERKILKNHPDEILDKKAFRRHIGLELMKCGVVSTTIFIIYVVSII